MYKIELQKMLNQKNRTKYWISKKIGMSPSNVGMICNGNTKDIKISTLYKICKALECTPNDILYDNENDGDK